MFASMSTFRGDGIDLDTAAKAVGETMESWLRQFEGYQGQLILTNQESGKAHVVTFWESQEAAERSRHGRERMRDQMAATVRVEVLDTEPFTVSYREWPAPTS